MGSTETANQRLASVILGRPVMDWIAEQRSSGHSWVTVATNLYDATDGEVDVSYEAVRLWGEQVAS